MTFRGFIAVDVPRSDALDALADELRRASPALKVVSTDRLHMTVKFLGDTDEGRVGAIVAAIRAAVADLEPFQIRVRGVGAFPHKGRPAVIWVGVEGAEPIAGIAQALEASLEPLGFPRERRPWTPHVTVARLKGRADLGAVRQVLAARANDEFGTHRVEAVHLKKSLLTRQGPIYSIVETIPLPGRASASGRPWVERTSK